jgi:hypothetical protein
MNVFSKNVFTTQFEKKFQKSFNVVFENVKSFQE